MTKHKLTTLVLVATCTVAFSACGSKGSSPSTGSPAGTRAPTPATVTPATSVGGGGGNGY